MDETTTMNLLNELGIDYLHVTLQNEVTCFEGSKNTGEDLISALDSSPEEGG